MSMLYSKQDRYGFCPSMLHDYLVFLVDILLRHPKWPPPGVIDLLDILPVHLVCPNTDLILLPDAATAADLEWGERDSGQTLFDGVKAAAERGVHQVYLLLEDDNDRGGYLQRPVHSILRGGQPPAHQPAAALHSATTQAHPLALCDDARECSLAVSIHQGATVAERLDCSLPPRLTGLDPGLVHPGFSQVGIVPDDAAVWRASPHFTLTGSQDRDLPLNLATEETRKCNISCATLARATTAAATLFCSIASARSQPARYKVRGNRALTGSENDSDACLKASPLWSAVEKLHITNMRVHLYNDLESGAYVRQLLEIAEGCLETDARGMIVFTNNFCNVVSSEDELIANVVPSSQLNINDQKL
ncbi:hypothetical protein PR048_018617 [Dryococelus australis]|uniref:Uncharacterized protein n=1 Tax=Dryococelus australis TaxID=614101 RepID=A0ABQ9HCZ2_9NEOP|nr:hypothetical protein PR048_018617 [Dryococelus australis]